jgi:hypothetical protein
LLKGFQSGVRPFAKIVFIEHEEIIEALSCHPSAFRRTSQDYFSRYSFTNITVAKNWKS